MINPESDAEKDKEMVQQLLGEVIQLFLNQMIKIIAWLVCGLLLQTKYLYDDH